MTSYTLKRFISSQLLCNQLHVYLEFQNFGRIMNLLKRTQRHEFFLLSLQENVMISQKTNLSDYYKSLRNNVITLLEQSRRPNDQSSGMKQQERVDSFLPKL